MSKVLEFFFDYSSPYSYLASTQVEALAERSGALLQWRPFLLGGVFKATGNVAPASNLVKARYLFKDLLDWTRHYRLPDFRLPAQFPMNSLLADRVGLAIDPVLLPRYPHAVYRAAFVEGLDVGEKEVLEAALSKLGVDPRAAFERASSDGVKQALRANTEQAVERGAFGAPTFFIGEDMYVGNDRLAFVEAALGRP